MHKLIIEITDELARAEKLHPDFPADLIRQVAIMSEEAGEAVKAANNTIHHGECISEVRTELIHTAAMCLRCLMALDADSAQMDLF